MQLEPHNLFMGLTVEDSRLMDSEDTNISMFMSFSSTFLCISRF